MIAQLNKHFSPIIHKLLTLKAIRLYDLVLVEYILSLTNIFLQLLHELLTLKAIRLYDLLLVEYIHD